VAKAAFFSFKMDKTLEIKESIKYKTPQSQFSWFGYNSSG
jgi:hypothetical protein